MGNHFKKKEDKVEKQMLWPGHVSMVAKGG